MGLHREGEKVMIDEGVFSAAALPPEIRVSSRPF